MRRTTVICLCHDVTEDDVARAIAQGYGHLETLKRYTGAMMGPCQGRMCRAALTAVYAELTGCDPPAAEQPSSRPPAIPVRLGVIAAAARDDDRQAS